MKRICRSIVYFLLLPLVAAALYGEASQNLSRAGHNWVRITIVILFCGLDWIWVKHDEIRRLREMVGHEQPHKKHLPGPNREALMHVDGSRNPLAAKGRMGNAFGEMGHPGKDNGKPVPSVFFLQSHPKNHRH